MTKEWQQEWAGYSGAVPRGQPHLPTRNRTMGNDEFRDYEGHRADALQGSRWGTEEYF